MGLEFDPAALPVEGDNAFTPDQVKGMDKFKGEDGIVKLAKGYQELEAFRGRSVVVPDDEASADDRAAFDKKVRAYQKVPDKAEGYEIELGDLPEGLVRNDDLLAGAKTIAAEEGITPKALQRLAELVDTDLLGRVGKMQEDTNAAMVDLTKELGGEAAFKGLVKKVEGVFAKFGGDDAQDLMTRYSAVSGAGRDPKFLKMMQRIAAETLAEDDLPDTSGAGKESAGREAQIGDIYNKSPELTGAKT